MTSPTPNHDRLEDVAVLYLALALGTDAELDQAELDLIIDRLTAWQVQTARGTVLGAVHRALALFEGAKVDEELVDAAIQRLRKSCSADERRSILDDLVSIAVADGKFLSEEGTLIHRLSSAWGVHHPAQGSLWNVFASGSGAWTPVHDLALLYLDVAHRPDEHIAPEEYAAITKKIKEWLPDARDADVNEVVTEALNVYAGRSDDAPLNRALASLKNAIPPHQRGVVISDLDYIACSDGVMTVEERVLIENVAQVLDLTMPEN